MPVTCNAADAPLILRYMFDGEWCARDLEARQHELFGAGQLTDKSCVLFDLRKATRFPSLDELRPAFDEATANGSWPVCRAFLVASQEQYDAARQLQALLGPHSVISEIFRDETQALDWLSAFAGRAQAARS